MVSNVFLPPVTPTILEVCAHPTPTKMMAETYWRAKNILIKGEVKLIKEESNPPTFLQFSVKQRSGEWTDVWRKIRYHNGMGIVTWSCNAVSKGRRKRWGCVMSNKPKNVPFCSHTLACKLLMDMKKKSERK